MNRPVFEFIEEVERPEGTKPSQRHGGQDGECQPRYILRGMSKVMKRVKIIKRKLEALERSNASHWNLLGCGPESSADRTQTSVVNGLGKKLKDMMDDFQGLRKKITGEYKEIVECRYNPNGEGLSHLSRCGEPPRGQMSTPVVFWELLTS
ncbi:hypothetical protein HHK36_003769 [Tetracentron sinense]|uniref:Syntaxin N-terminal domain-containing protein n=1 Tax=Tetracentron sinense TaxID=13715 RepID=A0A834ZNV5_TETSI|nr:hypothetical protein HHK36_003769 [Tetracentron sinense]